MRLLAAGIAVWVGGCAARVPLTVPAAPVVAVRNTEVTVVAVDRECREIADRLADELSALDGMSVRPDATTRLSVYACGVAWRTAEGPDANTLHASAQAILAVSVGSGMRVGTGGIVANLIGASRSSHRADGWSAAGIVRVPRGAEEVLYRDLARDLAEQVAPVSTLVHRRVYLDPAAGSARQFHNLAVDAERNGQLEDAVWWATRAWERRPSTRSARYLAELTRRLSRVGPEPLRVPAFDSAPL